MKLIKGDIIRVSTNFEIFDGIIDIYNTYEDNTESYLAFIASNLINEQYLICVFLPAGENIIEWINQDFMTDLESEYESRILREIGVIKIVHTNNNIAIPYSIDYGSKDSLRNYKDLIKLKIKNIRKNILDIVGTKNPEWFI